jgi:glycosyltransferase involved in cell wall biosynthesis
VDTALFAPERRSAVLRAQWGADDSTSVVLCVGRLAPEKNLDALVDTWRSMEASAGAGRLKLVLVGDGPSRAALQARLPHAHFAGLRRGEDLAAHYASADIFLFTSLTETFGNVVPEAMASGLAVVAFDYAAAAQLVRHGESGLLAKVADAGALREHAQALVRSPEQVALLGAAARQVATRQCWGRILEQIEAEYDAALRTAERWAVGEALRPAWRP